MVASSKFHGRHRDEPEGGALVRHDRSGTGELRPGHRKEDGEAARGALALVDSWGPGKHGELLAKAKETLGLGHGHANLLIHLARERAEAADPAAADDASDPLDSIYSGSKEPLRPRHEALMERLADPGPLEVAPKKTYVSLRRRKQFAMDHNRRHRRRAAGVRARGVRGVGLTRWRSTRPSWIRPVA